MQTNPLKFSASGATCPQMKGTADGAASTGSPGFVRNAILAGLLMVAAYVLTGGRTSSTLDHVVLSPADIDHRFTTEAHQAARYGLGIPDLPNVSLGLARRISRGEVTFYTIVVRDSQDQDADVITLRSPAMEYPPITLTNAGEVLHIPVIAGQAPVLQIVALRDGSNRNRVTVGVKTESGTWFSRTLPEGGTQMIPIEAVK